MRSLALNWPNFFVVKVQQELFQVNATVPESLTAQAHLDHLPVFDF